MQILIRLWRHNIVTNFLAGLFILLPVILTFFIIEWIVEFVESALGPGSFLGTILTRGGMTITGPNYETLAFFLGAAVALAGILILGMFARSAAQRSIHDAIDNIFTKMPLVRAIYNPISRVVRLTTDKNTDFLSMSVVICRIGGLEGADVLALLPTQEVYTVMGERRCMVYLPMAPFPMSGGLMMVSEDAVQMVPEMKVEELMRIYLSLGALAPDSMPEYLKANVQALPFNAKQSPVQVAPPATGDDDKSSDVAK
ncbi:MAG: DUF502 domain-containing protein [Alphaproteobacteria bacterium]